MHLFLTGVLPFLAHNHPAAAAFLTCRHHNFHASIIPEFLSDEERVKSFCEARQENHVEADKETQYKNLFNLFVQTPLMQFSPSLIVSPKHCTESMLNRLLTTTYFTRTLQRCSVQIPSWPKVEVFPTNDLLHRLSKVRSLTKLDLNWCEVTNNQLEIIFNSFLSLETLSIRHVKIMDPETAIEVSFSSPPPPSTNTLRNLTIEEVDGSFAAQFVPHFTNLKKLDLGSNGLRSSGQLDLQPLSSSLPLLEVMSLAQFNLNNIASLKNLAHLSLLEFVECRMPDSLNFLTQENSLHELTTLCIESCNGLASNSFASLIHAPNLRFLKLNHLKFSNDCLQYLQNMVHLRRLDLSESEITGDSRSLKTLMQNVFQLEELNLSCCRIGNQGAIAGALYSTHSRLRVLNLCNCRLVDDDLRGIGVLKNTLEELDLASNESLTTEGLRHCGDLVKLKMLNLERTSISDLSPLKCLVTLKKLDLNSCDGINDLSPLKDCLDLEELNVSSCDGLTDDSFKVFGDEPNSFPNLRVLDLSNREKLTEKVFEHLSKNINLVYQLKELYVLGMSKILSSSPTARNNISEFKSLSRLQGLVYNIFFAATSKEIEVMGDLLGSLKNLEEIKE